MIEFEYWWLLALPLFFTLGWLAARLDIKQLLSETSSLPAAYFKGLNFLISDQHDKAIEAFTEAVEANADSLELHFALGSLFRRRGEVDRAIHLHLSLLERQELHEPQKLAVMAELAQDYLKAGLFDRAEELFKSLEDTRYRQPALRALLEIYVREREWQRAIDMAIELERLSGIPFRKEVAQYHCELAVRHLLHDQNIEAKAELEKALDANKQCVRANVILGDIAAKSGQHEEAITRWKYIEFQQPETLSLVADKLLTSFRALDRLEEGLQLLRQYLQTYKMPTLLSVLFEATLVEQGPESALELTRDTLARKSTLQTLDHFLRAKGLCPSQDNQLAQDTQLMHQTVRAAIGTRSAYACTQCGFKAKHYHWQCPACNAWESLPADPSETML